MTTLAGSIGRFRLNGALVVQTWDGWMAAATGIPETAAHGVSIETLYPELAERGLLGRLRQVANGSGIEILAPALHKYFLPCAPLDPASHFTRMRQHVVLSPIHDVDGMAGVSVTIEDVTARFDRDRLAAANLDSDSETVRLRAATDLARHTGQTALLSDALGDDSWRVRRVAAEGLAASSDREVVTTLLDALRDYHRNPALLNSVLTALGRMGHDIALDVVPLLHADEADVRTYAALGLGLIGDTRATAPLLATLDADRDANVRFHAIEALGRIGDRRAAGVLAGVANQRDFFLSFPALDALAAIGDSSVGPSLLPLLDDALLATPVAACLGAIGEDAVVAPLVRAIARDGAPVVALACAVAAIARHLEAEDGNGTLVPELTRRVATDQTAQALVAAIDQATDDEIQGVILVASWLPQAGIDAALARQLRRESVRRFAADRLGRRGSSAAPFIEAMVSDPDIEIQRAAAFALGGISSASSAPTLLAMLNDEPDSSLIIVIAAALGSIGDASAFPTLITFLDHPETTVRQAAIGAISSIAHPEMEATVSAAFADSSPRVRESAARIASYFTYASCLDRIIAACADDDVTVRRAAVESLAMFEDDRAWAAVRHALASDAEATVRAAAARSLAGSADSTSRAAIRSALADRDLWVRYYAARAAARVEPPDADLVAALGTCVEHDRANPVRVAAIETLAALGASSQSDALLRAATSIDDDVSSAALRALGRLPGDQSLVALGAPLASTSTGRSHAALDALALLGASAGPAVAQIDAIARDARDGALSRRAIATLGRIGDQRAIRALLSLGANPALFADVVGALASDDDEHVASLEALLGDASEIEKGLVVAALARAHHARAATIIAKLVDDSSPNVRRWAEHALSWLDRRSFE